MNTNSIMRGHRSPHRLVRCHELFRTCIHEVQRLIVSSSVTIIKKSGPALPNLACMLATSSVNAEQAGETQAQLASAAVLLLLLLLQHGVQ